MRLTQLILVLLWTIACYGQSSSTHYQSNIRGSFTSGAVATSTHVESAVVSIWTEGHVQESDHYSNASVAVQNSDETSDIKPFTSQHVKFQIYPNPSENVFHINVDASLTDITIIVRDVTGKEVYRQKNTSPIPCSLWEQGLYLVTVQSGSLSGTERVIKL